MTALLRGFCGLQEYLDAIGGPRSNARAEEIAVFGPNRTTTRERRSENRPIVDITLRQALPRGFLKESIGIEFHGLDDFLERVEEFKGRLNRDAALRQNLREVSSRFRVSCVRSKELDAATIPQQQTSHSPAPYGANQNVRVEHKHS
jgi:hypothetical protein